MYKKFWKPIIDFFLAFFGLLVFSPLLIVTGIGLIFQNNRKVFFYQERPGKDQKPFYIIKFKTMTDKADNRGKLLPDKDRLTAFGRIIRKLSIDELPQLFNILKGDMSLVGPRPLLFKYVPLYSKEQLRRHEVKPGITGWAQVNGRNHLDWTKKLQFDVEYVDKINFILDVKIMLHTIKKVLKQEGINQTDSKPMEPFNGRN